VKTFDSPRSHGTDVIDLRALVDGIDAIIYETDLSGWVRFVNHRAEELSGYPAERWLSQPGFAQAIAHQEDRHEVRAQHYQCARYADHRQLEYRIVAADGRVVWVRELVSPSRGCGGAVRSLRSVMWKIDPPRKAARDLYAAHLQLADQLDEMTQLQELSQRLRPTLELPPLLEEILAASTSFQGAEIGFVRLYDPVRRDLRIVASMGLRPEFLARYGRVSVDDVACGLAIQQGAPVIIEDVEADAAAAYREPARVGGYRAKYSTLMTGRTGELLGTIATCFREPHRPSDREIRLVELLARQAADLVENARLKEALREADRRKDEALAALAHEIRNPLNAITSASFVLRAEAPNGSRSTELCELITREARLLGRLADELLEASRVGTGQTALKPETIDVSSAMARATQSVSLIAGDCRHKLDVVPPPAPITVEADPVRLEQMLVNLLMNASHYTDPGGRITVDAWEEAEQAAIRVRDTGAGISAELLPRIFEPFVRGTGESRSIQNGLGLGLALVKTFAERHGGSVTAMSEGLGRGSEFVLRLPKAQ
jgi:PAS domain S-box-containing protein